MTRNAPPGCAAFLALEEAARHTGFEHWCDALFTDKREPRQVFATKSSGADQGWIQDLLQAEAARVLEHARRINAARIVAATRALLRLAEPVLRAHRAAKAQSGRLDFEDLIRATHRLLDDPGSAWVLYKLDRGIDHILLDEAQDSNASQWGIVKTLTGEFFAGEGAAGRPGARSSPWAT